MPCDMPHERLWSWVHDEDDDAAARAEVAAHVEQCAECQAHVAEMREILGELDQIGLAPRRAEPSQAVPETLDGYRILRRIGQGGMGVVYEAEQRQPLRKVALKLVLGGRHADDLQIRMFEREVQALARLNHPGIAAIYEAGRTSEGQSYYAMELVEGVDLNAYAWTEKDWVKQPRVSLEERLRLFCEICEAIAYAHQRGIIHRDLKPSNILISGGGNPKILDFGLARAVERDTGVATLNTASGRMLGTLPYMSPEQAQGQVETVDVRTDVYALGVILYEMLTGRLPSNVIGLPVLSAVRVICEEVPLAADRAMPGVPTDLSIIASKALEKEPERRYQSVSALLDDVRRFRQGYPILARPPSAVYQFRKFAARHRLPLGLAAALVLSMLAAGAWMWREATREAQRIRRFNQILVRIYESPDPWKKGDKDVTVRETIDEAAKLVDRELADEPIVAASVRHTLGNLHRSFFEYDKADHQLRKALEIRRKLLGDIHADTTETMRHLGENSFLRGDIDEAENLFRAALSHERALHGPPHEGIAVNLNNLGLVMKTRGRLDEARNFYLDAMSMRKSLMDDLQMGTAPTVGALAECKANLAETLNNLGALARAERRLDQAKHYYLEAIRLRVEALGEVHPDVQKSTNNYAKLLYDLGEYEEAETYFRRVLVILRQGLGEEHLYIARAMHSLALTLHRLNRLDEAERECSAALAMRRAAVERGAMAADHPDLADSLELMGLLCLERGDAHGAATFSDEARALRESRSRKGE